MMEFLLNGRRLQVEEADASMTLLRFIRTEARCPGTKEGCASGDCGACTVLVGSPEAPLRSVNSCITPLGAVAGKQVVTVEGLSGGTSLHPAQQAMVDCHGSQCGFCTPGFVMSLAGLYEQVAGDSAHEPTEAELTESISGNLCRCTGYRPILKAGKAMFSLPRRAILNHPANQAGTGEEPLAAGRVAPPYLRPRTEAELRHAMADHPGAPLVAGATDWCLLVTQGFQEFPVVIDISEVDSLRGVEEAEDQLRIGAATTYAELVEHPLLASPALDGLLGRLGSPQIRHRGTVGGNLANASPIADMPPVLMAWDADVLLGSSTGAYRRVSLADFYTGYRQTVLRDGEYIAGVRLPTASVRRPHRFYKISKRFEDDISSVMLALSARAEGRRLSEVRVALGGMAAVPLRAPETEAVIEGRAIDEETLAMAQATLAAELSPISDVRATADYRRAVAGSLLRRGLQGLAGDDEQDLFALPREGVGYA